MTLTWSAAASPPDASPDPSGLDGLDWIPARIPGTAAAATGDPDRDYDAEDWWFRTELRQGGFVRLEGIATVSEVWLDGERLLESESMWARHVVPIERGGELAIRCRALAPLLAVARRPRARWRTKLVRDGNLRWFRTSVFGRAPGFAPGPAPVGPWRPVTLEDSLPVPVVLGPRLEGEDGVLAVRAPAGSEVELAGQVLSLPGGVGELRVPGIARWWPHTHGEPVLHDVVLRAGGRELARRRVGFRTLESRGELERDGLDLQVNGIAVWARGAVWTPVDPIGLAPSRAELRATLLRARDAGMNLLRIPGTGVYESPDFWDLCDELGLLVWQDFAFANLDYPVGDPGFRALVEQEADDVLADVSGRPSLAVLCGNSEVEQQVAMLGLAPELGRSQWFSELLPARVAAAAVDVPYVPSAPCGGAVPFRADVGVANWFGVGGYRRPLSDARTAGVRFAAECLALSNVPDDDALAGAGVPRDVGADWDFADVRDFYRDALHGPGHQGDLGRSREVSGEVMAAVLGEWRRVASPCRGGLVLWLRDVVPGAGWGVLDSGGGPKVAWAHLRRALAPVAVWMVDEGQGGVRIHVANDRPEPLRARLRLALYADGERLVGEAEEALEVAGRETVERDAEGLLGRWVDISWAYRFGPPQADVVVASLERAGAPVAQAFLFPAGRPQRRESAEALGLEVEAIPGAVTLRSRRLAWGVRLRVPGWDAEDDAFSLEPGRKRTVALRPREPGAAWPGGTLTALNLDGGLEL